MTRPRVRRFCVVGSLLIVTVLFMGCSDDRQAPVSPEALDMSSRAGTDLSHESVARGLALALGEPSLRARLIRAMRFSQLTEHKLVFQDFVDSRTGREIVSAAADGLGISDDQFRRKISDLPGLMDFYVPFESQRKRWVGSGDLLVASILEVDATQARAFDTSGTGRLLSSDDSIPAEAILVLHPAREIDGLEKNVLYSVDVKIHDGSPSSSSPLMARLWELDSFLAGGDKRKGEAEITGPGPYVSYDIFRDVVWAEYTVE